MDYGVQKTRSKKRKEALRNQVTFFSSGAAAMAPPDILDDQSTGESARTTSEVNNKTDFRSKKQRLSNLRKETLSINQDLQKLQPSFPNLNDSTFHSVV
jgi:hypothetical protein